MAGHVDVAHVVELFTPDDNLTAEAGQFRARYRRRLSIGSNAKFSRDTAAEQRNTTVGGTVPTVHGPLADVSDLISELGHDGDQVVKFVHVAVPDTVGDLLHFDVERETVVVEQRDTTALGQLQ